MFEKVEEVDLFSSLSRPEKEYRALLANIAVFIHRKRKEMGMNQQDFAQYMGVSQAAVSKWESGEENFTVERLSKIFSKLGMYMELRVQTKIRRG